MIGKDGAAPGLHDQTEAADFYTIGRCISAFTYGELT